MADSQSAPRPTTIRDIAVTAAVASFVATTLTLFLARGRPAPVEPGGAAPMAKETPAAPLPPAPMTSASCAKTDVSVPAVESVSSAARAAPQSHRASTSLPSTSLQVPHANADPASRF